MYNGEKVAIGHICILQFNVFMHVLQINVFNIYDRNVSSLSLQWCSWLLHLSEFRLLWKTGERI